MATEVNGRNIVLYKYNTGDYTSTPFACATSCVRTINTSTREVTNATSAFYREFKPDVIDWNISAGGFVILNDEYNYVAIEALIAARETFIVQFVVDNGGALGLSIFTGTVIITSYTITGNDDQLGTYSFELQGTGAYSTSGATVTPSGAIIISGTTMQVFQATATGDETAITFSGALGLTALYASRGGTTVQPIAYVGAASEPNGGVWNTSTGELELPAGNPAFAGELFLILAQ